MKTIYQCLSQYTIEQVNEVIETLSDEEKMLIERKYGSDLTKIHRKSLLTEEEKKRFNKSIMDKIKRRLKSRNNNNKVKTIYEYFSEYSKEQIDFAISRLPLDDKEILFLKYGEDLENPVKNEEWNTDLSKQFIFKVVRKIQKFLDLPNYVPNNKRTIYDTLKQYSKEQIDKAIACLPEKDLKVLFLRYGEDLEHPVKSKEWNDILSNKMYHTIIPKIKSLIVNPKLNLKKATNYQQYIHI